MNLSLTKPATRKTVTIPSEKSVIGHCWMIIYGPARGFKPLSDVERSKLFSDLKNRMQKRELALAIAKDLGWWNGIQEVGEPGGKQMQMGPVIALQREAEANGCIVSILHIPPRIRHGVMRLAG